MGGGGPASCITGTVYICIWRLEMKVLSHFSESSEWSLVWMTPFPCNVSGNVWTRYPPFNTTFRKSSFSRFPWLPARDTSDSTTTGTCADSRVFPGGFGSSLISVGPLVTGRLPVARWPTSREWTVTSKHVWRAVTVHADKRTRKPPRERSRSPGLWGLNAVHSAPFSPPGAGTTPGEGAGGSCVIYFS